MTRATHNPKDRFWTQAALSRKGDAQSGAQVLMSVLLAKPSGCGPQPRYGHCVDANRTAQAWFMIN